MKSNEGRAEVRGDLREERARVLCDVAVDPDLPAQDPLSGLRLDDVFLVEVMLREQASVGASGEGEAGEQ